MIGFAIGDIIGSRFEFKNHKTSDPYDFELFNPDCKTTDDTVCSVAIMASLLGPEYLAGTDLDYIKSPRYYYEDYLAAFGKKYIDKGYGARFKKWLLDDDRKPYQSFGNGSGMRVSPIGYWFDTLASTLDESHRSARPTHDHRQGIYGAQAVAGAIWHARNGYGADYIRKWVYDTFEYDLGRTVAEIRPTYKFEVSCQKSIPEAIICALEGRDFEEVARLAISLGGDSDTICSIACAIAEARFGGVPEKILTKAIDFIEPEFLHIIQQFAQTIKDRQS